MTDQEQKNIFSKNLKSLLEEHQLSQREFARSIGEKPTTVNGWCKATTLPRMGKIEKIANFFNIRKTSLIDDHAEVESSSKKSDQKLESLTAYYYERLNDKGKSLADSIIKALTFDPDLSINEDLDDMIPHKSNDTKGRVKQKKKILMAAHGTTEDMTDEEMDLVHKDFEKLMELDRKMHPEDYDD